MPRSCGETSRCPPYTAAIDYHSTLAGVTSRELQGFFGGWPNAPTSETLVRLLQVTDHFVLARGADGHVVGFVTAMSDGVLSAYISLLEVLPGYRNRGIGSELVRRILTQIGDIYMVDTLCDPELVPFYARLGFSSATGVSVRRFDRQAGTS